ncbi:MAG: 30S ribosomal protein S4 [Planctomycetota bacterium]|jgi:small subunit ribosomal protein S4|nr:30S ribosomal protein S4 [Blastopirellula sp.]
MSRYTGPKGRVNRRIGMLIYENGGASRAMERRGNQPPGMHTRAKRPSNYGKALTEKQKIKHYYGLGERQLRRYFEKAGKMKGNTGENLLIICESRLDNVIRRVGLTATRPQARQGVAHGHFRVNGVKVDRPSYMLRPGDVVTIRPQLNVLTLYRNIAAQGVEGQGIEWASLDSENLTINVTGAPGASDISLPVDGNVVVEFMSR